MLIENNSSSNFSIGDFVRVKSTGQTGKIVEYRDGRWIVEIGTQKLPESATNLVKTQVLMG